MDQRLEYKLTMMLERRHGSDSAAELIAKTLLATAERNIKNGSDELLRAIKQVVGEE